MESASPSAAESVLARVKEEGRARLRLYIGAAPGVGKSYRMLEDAHELRRQGVDVVIGFIEPHGRADTKALVGDLEQVPMRELEYRGVLLREMDVEAIKARRPAIAVVDELAHTNVPGIRRIRSGTRTSSSCWDRESASSRRSTSSTSNR